MDLERHIKASSVTLEGDELVMIDGIIKLDNEFAREGQASGKYQISGGNLNMGLSVGGSGSIGLQG